MQNRGGYAEGCYCCGNETMPWWKTTIVYQIYPRSFKDSNGDGIGDLKGIISKMDYFTYLGVGAIWLSPFYPSPQKDFGYDVEDFCDVDPQFGRIEDFTDLVKEARKRDIKVIVDFVPGHTSSESTWFKKSIKREGKYTDYYIWSDGILQRDGRRTPPNNWLSVFGGSAWTWVEERGQYYYHAFLKEQPTLNHRNPEVEEEMKSVIRYWLNKGVDGLRVDAIPFMFVVEDLSRNEGKSDLQGYEPDQHNYLEHSCTMSQPEVKGAIEDYMSVMNEYEARDGRTRLMILETFENATTRNQYYPTGAVPFNMDLTQSEALGLGEPPPITGHLLNTTIMDYYNSLPDGAWPNFVVSNHDVNRVTKRYGPQYTNVYNMLLLTLRGTPTCYYGEELGMMSPQITWKQNKDPQGTWYGPEKYAKYTRDYSRSPMQWDDTDHAGFTDGKSTWLPIDPSFKYINVKTQSEAPSQSSLQLFRQLASLRQEPAFRTGTLTPAFVDDNIFSYVRESENTRYLVAMNFGKEETRASYESHVNASSGHVIASTGMKEITNGQTVELSDLVLKPGDGLVIFLDCENGMDEQRTEA